MADKNLTLKDYLETASDASKRTRSITIILVVATVLVFVAFLNSSDLGWIQQRLDRLNDESSAYANLPFNKGNTKLNEDLLRSAVENTYVVRVPFFAVAFDVNDLGLLGGIGLIIILVLLRFSLRSQIISLRVGFKEAFTTNEAEDFYDLLAAKQVFVFPELKDPAQNPQAVRGEVEKIWESLKKKISGNKSADSENDLEWVANRTRGLRFLPKLICLMPFPIYFLIVLQDYESRNVGYMINYFRTQAMLFFNFVFLLSIFFLGIWCISKWNEIDRLWDYFKDLVEKKKTKSNLTESSVTNNLPEPIAG